MWVCVVSPRLAQLTLEFLLTPPLQMKDIIKRTLNLKRTMVSSNRCSCLISAPNRPHNPLCAHISHQEQGCTHSWPTSALLLGAATAPSFRSTCHGFLMQRSIKVLLLELAVFNAARHLAGRTDNRSGHWRGAAGGLRELGTEGHWQPSHSLTDGYFTIISTLILASVIPVSPCCWLPATMVFGEQLLPAAAQSSGSTGCHCHAAVVLGFREMPGGYL